MAKLGTFGASQVLTAAELNAGAGAWASWSPTYTSLTIGNGVVGAKYAFFGRTVFFKWAFSLGSTSAVGTGPSVTLPVTPSDTYETNQFGCTLYDLSANAHYQGMTQQTTGVFILCGWNVAGTYATKTQVTNVLPFTWATGDTFYVSGTYEATS